MFEIVLEITDKCPLCCLHCSTNASANASNELSCRDIQIILNDARTLGVDTVVISGGEPFCHSELDSVLRLLADANLRIKLYSCGVIFRDTNREPIGLSYLAKLKGALGDRLTLIFSVHGGESTVHDGVTQIKGSFDILKESVNRAMVLNLDVETHFVPMKVNADSLESVYDFALQNNIPRLSLLRFVPQGRGRSNINNLLLSHGEATSLLDKARHLRATSEKVTIRIGSPFNCLISTRPNPCNVAVNRVLINPFGDVFPCEAFKQQSRYLNTDNTKTSSLSTIFHKNEIFRRLRYRRNLFFRQTSAHENADILNGCPAQSFIHSRGRSFDSDPYLECAELVIT